jgi:cell pole-organizing protein PopZ
MTQPAKAQEAREPSMEEILASIRRIIADDKPEAEPAVAARPAAAGTPPAATPPAATSAAADANSQADIDAMLASFDAEPAPVADDVLELTEDMAVADPSPGHEAGWAEASDDDLEFSESPVAEELARATGPDRDHAERDADGFDPLRAEPEDFEPRGFGRRDATAFERIEPAVTGAAQPMLSQATVSAVESAFNSLASTVLSNNARTLEDLVKEMLRPMLKSWLDDNLPMLVERIVRAEIERVSRGR